MFNQRDHELDAGLIDVAAYGVPAWDAEVDYTPASDAACFATTATGLHLTNTATGPATGNATDPDAVGQDGLEDVLMGNHGVGSWLVKCRNCGHEHRITNFGRRRAIATDGKVVSATVHEARMLRLRN